MLRILAHGLAVALAVFVWCGPANAQSSGTAQTLAAWDQIAAVLQYPRCLNCHQLNSPLQGDDARPHVPRVVRGKDGHGVGAMRCSNCHNESGNNETSRTPGAMHWQLAPVSMLWQGLSSAELCEMLQDRTRNGNRSGDDLVEHMDEEHLVIWSWAPGLGREPVPLAHDEFMRQMKIWNEGGMACPSE